MDAYSAIAALDDALAQGGVDAVLRRVRGSAPSLTHYDVAVRVRIDGRGLEEVSAGISATAARVIMSLSEIAAAAWPDDGETGDVPKGLPRRLDRLQLDGRWRSIERVDAKYVGGALVRIELMVAG